MTPVLRNIRKEKPRHFRREERRLRSGLNPWGTSLPVPTCGPSPPAGCVARVPGLRSVSVAQAVSPERKCPQHPLQHLCGTTQRPFSGLCHRWAKWTQFLPSCPMPRPLLRRATGDLPLVSQIKLKARETVLPRRLQTLPPAPVVPQLFCSLLTL